MSPAAQDGWSISAKAPNQETGVYTKNSSDPESELESPTMRGQPSHSTPQGESLEARIERLGRERPAVFKNAFSEIGFVFSIVISQILTEYFVSGFTLLIPTIVRDLNIPQSEAVWPATAFSLLIASTLLIFGRLGDMFGGYPVYLFGLAWMLLWSIIAGFAKTDVMLDFARAFQGLGAAAFLPTGVMLMGSIYRPGPRKNLVFAIYGTFAVIGFYVGILLAGIVGQYIYWGWYFWIGAAFTFVTLISSFFSIPNDYSAHKGNGVKMDYPGAVLIVSSLIIIIYSITASAHAPQGWATPYIPTLFVIGVLLLLAAVYVEARVAAQPLLPGSIFTVNPAMGPLTVAIMLLYGTWGILILYGTLYFENILDASPIQLVAWYAPIFIGGIVFSIMEGYVMHIVPGRALLVISGIAAVTAQLLLAFLPVEVNYWAWLLPTFVCSTVGIDLSYIVMTVFVTTALPTSQQGLGGGLINSVVQLGVAFCLGFADIIQVYTYERNADPDRQEALRQSYKNTFWLGVGISGTGLLLMAIWGKVPKAKSDLTVDERRELEREAQREQRTEDRTNLIG